VIRSQYQLPGWDSDYLRVRTQRFVTLGLEAPLSAQLMYRPVNAGTISSSACDITTST